MSSPFVYLPGVRLSEAELSAACLDGDLVPLGPAYIPADVPETAAIRAATLAAVVGPTIAATHTTAAWIHGGIDRLPERHAVQRAVARRIRPVIDHRVTYRDPRVPPEDLVVLGGVAVTSIGRTVADLARTPSDGYGEALAMWALIDPGVIEQGSAWLEARYRVPHRRLALQTLRALAVRVRSDRQDDVTR